MNDLNTRLREMSTQNWRNLFASQQPQENPEPKVLPLSQIVKRAIENLDDLSKIFVKVNPAAWVKVLPNGMRICIEQRKHPEHKQPVFSMELNVACGYLHEIKEEEAGIAHLLEHCLYLGTRTFSKNDIKDLLRLLGCQDGADSNATTSSSKTVYHFHKLSINNEHYQKAIQLFYEFCSGPSFPEEILKERDVVSNELLRKKGVGNKIYHHDVQLLYPNSQYEKRGSCELSEEIKNADFHQLQALLKAFHKKGYCPAKLTLVVVGDFGDEGSSFKRQKELMDSLSRLFETLPSSLEYEEEIASLDKKYRVTSDWNMGIQQSQFTHEEIPTPYFCLYSRIKFTEGWLEKRKQTLARFFQKQLLQFNTFDSLKRGETPWLSLVEIDMKSIHYHDSTIRYCKISPKEGQWKEALDYLFEELRKIQMGKYNEFNLDVFLKSHREHYLNQLCQYPTLSHESVIARYGTKSKVESLKAYCLSSLILLNYVPKEEWKRRIAESSGSFMYTKTDERALTLNLYNRRESETHLKEMISILWEKTFDPKDINLNLIPSINYDSLLNSIDQKVTFNDLFDSQSFDSTELFTWRFNNGIKAIFKSFPNIYSQHLVQVIIPRGKKFFSREAGLNLQYAIMALNLSGIGGHSNTNTVLYQSNLGINKINLFLHENYGELSCLVKSGADLTALFKFIYLHLMRLENVSEKEFQTLWEERIKLAKQFLEKNKDLAQTKIARESTTLMANDHPYFAELTIEELDQLSMEKGKALLKEYMQSLADATVIICGHFDKSNLAELSSKYIGSLETNLSQDQPYSWPSICSSEKAKQEIYEGIVADQVTQSLSIPLSIKRETGIDWICFNISVSIIQEFLNRRIRQDEQLTYGITFGISKWLDVEFAVIKFICAKKEQKELSQAVWKEIDAIQKLSDNELEILSNHIKSIMIKKSQNSIEGINYWVTQLVHMVINKYDLNQIINVNEENLKLVTLESIRSMITKIFADQERCKEFTIYPKE